MARLGGLSIACPYRSVRESLARMVALFLSMEAIALVALALQAIGIIPQLPGLGWASIHFLTIGVATQAIVATLPFLIAAKRGTQPPNERITFALWLGLNLGFVLY